MFCPSTAGQVLCPATGVSGTPGCPLGCVVDATEEVGDGDSGAGDVDVGDAVDGTEPLLEGWASPPLRMATPPAT